MSTLPSYSPVKASVSPSGDKYGRVSMPGPTVRRVAVPPCRLTVHRSAAYANTIWFRFIAGLCSRCVVSLAAKTIGAANTDRSRHTFFIGGTSGVSLLLKSEPETIEKRFPVRDYVGRLLDSRRLFDPLHFHIDDRSRVPRV